MKWILIYTHICWRMCKHRISKVTPNWCMSVRCVGYSLKCMEMAIMSVSVKQFVFGSAAQLSLCYHDSVPVPHFPHLVNSVTFFSDQWPSSLATDHLLAFKLSVVSCFFETHFSKCSSGSSTPALSGGRHICLWVTVRMQSRVFASACVVTRNTTVAQT